jgi:hypothetical protein
MWLGWLSPVLGSMWWRVEHVWRCCRQHPTDIFSPFSQWVSPLHPCPGALVTHRRQYASYKVCELCMALCGRPANAVSDCPSAVCATPSVSQGMLLFLWNGWACGGLWSTVFVAALLAPRVCMCRCVVSPLLGSSLCPSRDRQNPQEDSGGCRELRCGVG